MRARHRADAETDHAYGRLWILLAVILAAIAFLVALSYQLPRDHQVGASPLASAVERSVGLAAHAAPTDENPAADSEKRA